MSSHNLVCVLRGGGGSVVAVVWLWDREVACSNPSQLHSCETWDSLLYQRPNHYKANNATSDETKANHMVIPFNMPI